MSTYYFSESSLAKHLGTTRHQIAISSLQPTCRAGSTKVYTFTEKEVQNLKRMFASDNDRIASEFERADDKRRDQMVQDPNIRDVLKYNLRPRLQAEHFRNTATQSQKN